MDVFYNSKLSLRSIIVNYPQLISEMFLGTLGIYGSDFLGLVAWLD